ncbi:MAG: diadenylate cyclase CdaA [Candidatus Heteroscillospira sp.]|jgi:diadenylate cyclase
MDAISDILLRGVRYISMVRISDIVDMLIVAFLIYKLAMFIRKNNSSNVANGILIILITMWLSDQLHLNVINFILRKTMELGFLALVILFQPELRRVLEKMGSSKISHWLKNDIEEHELETAITQTVLACADMSKAKTGALVVFERANKLSEPLTTGTLINADTTAELLKNIFFNKAPLHDGAVIIREGRILAAGCMLPMSGNTNLSKDLGMRHRAGIGCSETSDAVVVICSEETGAISVAVEGMLKRHLTPETVETLLRKELMTNLDDEKPRRRLSDIFKVNNNAKK